MAVEATLIYLGFNSVENACNGKEALSKINQNEYDLIITDNQMPQMTGE